jgi:ABC-type multidrug transport system fused ATPase/permease subunit
LSRNINNIIDIWAERVSDVLGNMPVIQSFARVEHETRALGAMIDRMLNAQMPVLTWWALASVATRSSASLSLVAIFMAGIWLDMNGRTSIGEIVAFMSLAGMLIGRLEQVVGFINMMFAQAPKMKQFFEILDQRSSVADRPGALAVGRLQGAVSFEDVSFSYLTGRQAIENVSFHVPAGQTVALVGATGSGKSTLLSLLHRVFDPCHGRILIDGRDIRDLTLRSLRESIAVVFQEPFIFARSIEENLRIGDPQASAGQIAAALQQAQARAFVERQPLVCRPSWANVVGHFRAASASASQSLARYSRILRS